MSQKIYAHFYDFWHPDDNLQEYAFYKSYVQKTSGHTLELGCGTGRLLLPLMKEDYAIEGLDCSQDMIDICMSKAREQDLSPTIYHQKIESLSVHKRYSLIVSARETFQSIVDRSDAIKALHAIYKHLEAGGTFVCYISLPWLYAPLHASEWRQIGEAEKADGTYSLHEKSVHDPIEQVYYHSYNIKKNNVHQHAYDTTIRWYSVYEFKSLLAAAGFTTIKTQPGYSGDGPYDVILFVSQK